MTAREAKETDAPLSPQAPTTTLELPRPSAPATTKMAGQEPEGDDDEAREGASAAERAHAPSASQPVSYTVGRASDASEESGMREAEPAGLSSKSLISSAGTECVPCIRMR